MKEYLIRLMAIFQVIPYEAVIMQVGEAPLTPPITTTTSFHTTIGFKSPNVAPDASAQQQVCENPRVHVIH